MKKIKMTLAMVLFAIVLGQYVNAAQAPGSPPQSMKETLKLMGEDLSDVELLRFAVAAVNEGMQEEDARASMFIDDKGKTVIMQMPAEDSDLTPEDVASLSPEMTMLFKNHLLNTWMEDDDLSSLMMLIATAGYNFELQGFFSDKKAKPLKIRYTADELADAISDWVGAAQDEAEAPADDEVETVVEDFTDSIADLSEDEIFAALIAMMNEELQEDGTDAHIWLDDNSNAVIFSLTDEEFADMASLGELGDAIKPMFLKMFMSADENAIGALLGIIAESGRDFEVRYCTPGDREKPFVLRFTPEELNAALNE